MSALAYRIERATPESRIALVLAVAGLVALAAGPWWLDRNGMRLAGEFFVYLGLATLWNLLAGYAGLVSVGQQAYVGFGGYFLFGWAMLAGLPPVLAVPAAGVAAAILSLPVSLLVFRLKGAYFAIGTWVVAEVFMLLASQLSVLGGGSGVSLPISVIRSIGSTRSMREIVIYYETVGVTVAIVIAVYLLLRSRWGLALQAIRDNETAAETSGVSVASAKRLLYVVACGGAAMIGALIFMAKLRISPSAGFSVNDWTAFVIFITVIGGIGRIEGPIVGTILFFVLRETLSDLGAWYLIVLGAVAVAIMLFAPKGLWGLLADRFGWQLFPVGRRLVINPDTTKN
ncbi:MAG: branched-chain amino acid ABC transporter permease [Beijerinckiaceae bacterium]